jgi:hypothetical protein
MSEFPDIWILDENHRVYTEAKPNSLWGTLIWRKCWRKRRITGETRVSWIIDGHLKISKKGPWFGVAFSEAEIDRRVWIHDHGYKIAKAVEDLRHADGGFEKLKAVAEIVGYPVKAPA